MIMENAAQPAERAGHEWEPQDVTGHNQRAHAFAQTGTQLRLETMSLFVTSSRGYGRELPSTGFTRSPLKSRRYTIDASLATPFQYERDYSVYHYDRGFEDLNSPTQSIAKTAISVRETDEPVHRRTQITLPDPLRYRELHRWGCILPCFNKDKYPGDDGPRRFFKDTYAQFSNGPLRNEDFNTIIQMEGAECWYTDDVMDAAMALCSMYYAAEDNAIMAVGPGTVQAFKFASLTDGELDMTELQDYAPMFRGKKWILMPLNDGIGGTSAAYFQGSHWSLLAIDRPNKKAIYIDGMNTDMERMARRYACALQKMVDDEKYTFSIELNAPHQWYDNHSGLYDCGPCGPYVVKMITIMMAKIRGCRDAGQEDEIALHLSPGFQWDFDSYVERRSLEYTIASFKADQVAKERATFYAENVLGLPGLLRHTEIGNPTWSAYDAPLFTQQSLTYHKANHYKELKRQQHQRHTSIDSDSSSGSSGGISIDSKANGPQLRGGWEGAQDNQIVDDAVMQDRPI